MTATMTLIIVTTRIAWTVVCLFPVFTMQTNHSEKSIENSITYNEIACDRSLTENPCPQWMYCDTLNQLCRSCSVCPPQQTDAKLSRECSLPTKCRTSTITPQHIYCSSLRDILNGRMCEVECQPGPHVGTRNPLGTICRTRCRSNQAPYSDTTSTLACLYHIRQRRASWNGTGSDFITNDPNEPSSLLTTKTTVSLTSGTVDASAHFTSIFNDDDVSASSLANTSTLLVTNWTTAPMTSLFDDNTTISVIVISILVIFVLALVVCLVLGVRWKLCSVCYQSPLSADTEEPMHTSPPSASYEGQGTITLSHLGIILPEGEGHSSAGTRDRNDVISMEQVGLLAMHPRKRSKSFDEHDWSSDDEDVSTSPKTSLQPQVCQMACQISLSLHSSSSRILQVIPCDMEREVDDAVCQLRSSSRSSHNPAMTATIHDSRTIESTGRSSLDCNNSETYVKQLLDT